MKMKYFNKISVVVPARNEDAHIEKCLSALTNQDYDKEAYEIIVVDNDSTDETKNLVKKFANVRLISCPKSRVGRVRNAGALVAEGSILAFIDADCVPAENWLSNISERLIEKNLILGGGIILPEPAMMIEKYWLLEGPEGHNLPKELIGASIAISKIDFEIIGGFNEKISSGEDNDFSLRAKRLGYSVIISKNLSVVHLGNAKDSKSFIKRQIWHSENYFIEVEKQLKDPIFYLTLTFTFTTYATIISLFINAKSTILLIMFLILITSTLSIKRIIRSGFEIKKPFEIALILYLDLIYLIGRMIGAHISLFKALKSHR